jgi:hypothetical protein
VPQPEWEALEREVRDLSRRVAELERYASVAERAVTPAEPLPEPAAVPASPPALGETALVIAVIGRAFLGLAGAYLLRALTEAGTLPVPAGVAAGIAYAVGWLAWASRTPPARRLETAIHSLTAALVLSPLLWEATLHFHAIGTWTASAILLLFVVSGMAAAWRKNLLIVSTIATLAGLGTAAGLLLATHDVLPFTFLFLAAAEAVEISASLDHYLSERWVAAIAADLSVLLATWLVTNERGLPEAYAPIPHSWLLAAQVALLAIYLSSTIVRTLLCGFTFTGFETLQGAAAFAITVNGGLRLSTADHRIAPAIALFMLCCAAACYLVGFVLLERRGSRGRNFYTYSTFGILLALAGSRILLAGPAAAALWGTLALAGILAGGIFSSLTLEIHGGIYLLLALFGSGSIYAAAAFLLGSVVWPGDRAAALWLGAAAAAASYALSLRFAGRQKETWNTVAFRVVLAATSVWMFSGIAAGAFTGLYHFWFGINASHAYCATLRTGVVVVAALALAGAGSRWNRPELAALIYPAMLLAGYRLVAEDLRQDRKVALFLSLLIYGLALTLLPRLKKTRPEAAAS